MKLPIEGYPSIAFAFENRLVSILIYGFEFELYFWFQVSIQIQKKMEVFYAIRAIIHALIIEHPKKSINRTKYFYFSLSNG